jgi:fibronectin type 3 domain-containing protein
MTSQASAKGSNPKVVFEDVLSPQTMGPQRYAGYAVEVFNDRGRSAGLSNQVRIPLAPTLPPPTDLRVDVTSNGPVLRWTGQSHAQLGGLTQTYGFRYRIYRRLTGQSNYMIVGETQLDGPQYVAPDASFEWEKSYDYKVTSVTEIPASGGRLQAEIEGDDSPITQAKIHDVFPPARPTGLQAVFSGVGQKPFIDLSWAPNTESDLAGYTVYRYEKGEQPVALNKEPAKAPAFRDDGVQAGRTYYYFVQAVDVRGNLSESSQEANETIPGEKQ